MNGRTWRSAWAVAALAVLTACGSTVEETPEPVVRPAKLFTVETSSNEFSVTYPAVIEASQSSVLAFQVGGVLQELPVNEGDVVARGDLIARLDDRDFRSAVAAARTQFETAQADYTRARELLERGTISRATVDQRRSSRDVARSNFETAQKALDDSALRAPFDGAVASINVENFQNVAPGAPIVTLQSAGAIDAAVNVPARILAFIPQLQPQSTLVTLDASPDARLPATFKEAAGQADPTTQTYRVRFSFVPPDDLLILPGMTGSVSTTFLYSGDDVNLGVAVPPAAVLADGDDRFVWVVDAETMTVSRRAVTIAPERFADMIAVVDGLEVGETIVAAGAAQLFDGMTVRPWTPT